MKSDRRIPALALAMAWFGAVALASSCASPAANTEQPGANGPADLVLRGGVLHTMDPERPRASALAVRGKRIIAVGEDAEMARHIGSSTRVIELAGRALTPGLTDSHCHLYSLGTALESVDLRDVASAEKAAQTIAAAAGSRPAGTWMVGRGWDQNLWPGQEFPTAAVLDAVLAEHPVAVRRIDGHALWTNTVAMERAGIQDDTPDPPGGLIVRDPAGRATGVFIDAAMHLVEQHIPQADRATIERTILRASQEALAAGITTVHEMGIPDRVVDVYRELASEGRLPIRVYGILSGDVAMALSLAERPPDIDDTGEAMFVLRAIKLYADGALGSRGAALLAPYTDDPDNRGLWITPAADLERAALAVAGAGWQMAVHAIGDAGNRAVLDAFAAARAAHPERDLRFRVEHAQILSPEDLPRLAELEVIASMQPTHATSDMPWAEARVGAERIRGGYAWRSILDSGARLAAGSDFPVEKVTPLLGIHAAVTRQDESGEPPGGWYPDERMTLEEALRAFTLEGAYASFSEAHRGRLRPGQVADITVFDRPLAGDGSLLETQVDMTVVNGQIRFER